MCFGLTFKKAGKIDAVVGVKQLNLQKEIEKRFVCFRNVISNNDIEGVL
jgi:hypothetical protein